jgi:outer membrane protein
MRKRILVFLFALFCFGFTQVEAQQITRFAVVDLPQVYTAFFSQSRAVREFEERSARVQSEIDRMTQEIQNLRVNMVNAQAQGNNEQALRIEADITRRSDFLREYHRTQTANLEAQRANLSRSESFMEQVYDEIRFIAESEGFSMVLNLRQTPGIIWHSQTVDITDRLIRNLMTRQGR